MVTCAATIRRVGSSPDPLGNKLQARFSKPFPAKVQVKGTTDVAPVHGQSGIWISSNKYTGLQQTLVLQDSSGSTLGECSYDTNGNLISNCFVEFVYVSATKFTESDPSGATVTKVSIDWGTINVINLTDFDVQRSSTQTGIFTKINSVAILYDGNTDYSFLDESPMSGDNWYRVVAKCSGGVIAKISDPPVLAA